MEQPAVCEDFNVIFYSLQDVCGGLFNDSSQLVFVKQVRIVLMVFYDLELQKTDFQHIANSRCSHLSRV